MGLHAHSMHPAGLVPPCPDRGHLFYKQGTKMKHLLLASAAILALLPSVAVAQTTDSSPIDSVLPADDTANVATPAAPASTGNAVLDRLNAINSVMAQTCAARASDLKAQPTSVSNGDWMPNM